MGKIATLAPSVLFCAPERWADEEKRDEYLEEFFYHLEWMEELGVVLSWSSEMESALWEHPTVQPWRKDRDWRLRMVPTIHHKMNKLGMNFDEPMIGACSCQPNIIRDSFEERAGDPMLQLLHRVLLSGFTPRIVLGSTWKTTPTFLVFSPYTENTIACSSIRLPSEWLDTADQVWFWPLSDNDSEWLKFSQGLERLGKWKFGSIHGFLPETTRYSLGNRFQEDLLEADLDRRISIVEALAKRLHMTRQQASSDKGLHDEPWYNGEKGERRFRVSQDERIHYVEEPGRGLRFKRYFSGGNYDDAYC